MSSTDIIASSRNPSLLYVLPTDALLNILFYIEPVEIVNTVSCCNKAIQNITSGREFWLTLFSIVTRNPPPDHGARSLSWSTSYLSSLTVKQIQQCTIVSRKRNKAFTESKNGRAWFTRMTSRIDTNNMCPISLLPKRSEALAVISQNRGRYCLCSTRDRYVEVVENVLTESRLGYDWLEIFKDNHSEGDEYKTANEDGSISNVEINNDNESLDIDNLNFLNFRGLTNRELLQDGESHQWWSSAPNTKSSPDDTNEVLLFTFRKNKNTSLSAIVTEVAIKPLTEPGFFNFNVPGGATVYSWPRISLQVFDLPPNTDRQVAVPRHHDDDNGNGSNDEEVVDNNAILLSNEMMTKMATMINSVPPEERTKLLRASANQRPLINAVIQNQKPTYSSPIMDATSTDSSWQYYSIPDGVVGNVVVITLWGKTFEQFQQSGYYVCVDKVSIRGFPLIP